MKDWGCLHHSVLFSLHRHLIARPGGAVSLRSGSTSTKKSDAADYTSIVNETDLIINNVLEQASYFNKEERCSRLHQYRQ